MPRPYPRVHPVVVSVLAVAACGGPSQVTPMTSVPPGVIVDLQEQPYEVTGADVATLHRELRTRGPRPHFARFRWRIDTSYRYGPVENASVNPGASRETECELQRVEIRLGLRTVMPRWLRPPGASEELAARWATFEENLRVHEEGHRDVALRAAADLANRYRRLRTSNCAFIQREARDVLDEVLEKWNEVSREYDATTKHGRTQGAVWPPAGSGG